MTQQIRTKADAGALKRGTSKSSSERKQSIIALLMMAVALLVFLALVSYDARDEAAADLPFSDLLKVFSGDPQVQAKADTAHNWLGLVGAIISDFLIKSTFGYSVFCFPVLVLLFGWTLLRRGDFHRLTIITNYTLISALLISAAFGMSRLIFGQESLSMSWSGVVGDFLATILAQLLGRAGGSILLLTALLAVAVLVTDLDLRMTTERLKNWVLRFMDWISRRRDTWQETRLAKQEARKAEQSVVKVSKPPLEEPLAPKKAEVVMKAQPRPLVSDQEGDEEENVPQLSAARQKEMRLEIEQKMAEEEVNFDERPAATIDFAVPEEIDYVFPSVELLDAPRPGKEEVDEEELKANAALLRDTLAQFDVEVESVSVTPGPVVTLYELVPAVGVKISRIVSLENDIALKLAAKGIRIMAPIPGKSAVGV
ncbi:MAG: DNA translocase FtsK 4TM domain-containing protein, partial [Bacteroidota bacterium]